MRFSTTYPPANRGKLIVWGLLGSRPFGGMTWQVLHYVAGFRKLGFDTWYVEDSSIRPLGPTDWNPVDDHSVTAGFIHQQMELAGLGDRWVFRPSCVSDECHGALDLGGLEQLYRDAHAVFNLCGSHKVRPEHTQNARLVLVETDPVPYQVRVSQGREGLMGELDKYKYLFTYGENLGESDCPIPLQRYNWLKTRPPVFTEWWSQSTADLTPGPLTTVANFNTSGVKDVEWNGAPLVWSKEKELERFVDLPRQVALPLEMSVVGLSDTQITKLEGHGWTVRSAKHLSSPLDYRTYIRNSAGEFSTAKQQYVSSRSGWFSDRSVCYLASGRPVVMQDTAFHKYVPTGEGLYTYGTPGEAAEAIAAIAADYQGQSAAALRVAHSHFSTDRVLSDMLSKIGLS